MVNLEKKTKTELLAMIEELQKRLDASLSTVVTDSTEALTAEIAALREIIEISCKDHCPHHQQEESCRNCAIKKRLDGIGK